MSRLSFALEKLVPSLDVGYTSGLSLRGLLQLLWMMTKLKPSLKISHLRALSLNQPMPFLSTDIFGFCVHSSVFVPM